MSEPMKHTDIMAIASKAAPIDAQQVYQIVESSVKKKTATLEIKIDALTDMVAELSKLVKSLKAK
jgi:hypothetical protein